MRLSFWPAVPSLTAALNGSCGIETWRSILIISSAGIDFFSSFLGSQDDGYSKHCTTILTVTGTTIPAVGTSILMNGTTAAMVEAGQPNGQKRSEKRSWHRSRKDYLFRWHVPVRVFPTNFLFSGVKTILSSRALLRW